MYCDFCNRPDPVVCYLARRGTFIVQATRGQDIEINTNAHWIACPVCELMIDQNRRFMLAKRAHAHSKTRLPLPVVLALHEALFWNSSPVKHGPAHEVLNGEGGSN